MSATRSWLLEQHAPEAAIVAHEAGAAASDEDARRWIGRLLDDQEPAGSWGGDLLATAEALLTIGELRAAAGVVEQDPGVGRARDWIRARRGVPGSWAEGCSPDRHRLGLCHHFVGGMFSAAPPEVLLPEARLRCGARITGDAEVRLVASTTALRCALGWDTAGRDEQLHLAALRRLVAAWDSEPPAELTTTALLAAIHALAASEAEEDREAMARGLRLLAGKQRGDGSWVETDAFQALDVIGAAADAAPERTLEMLWHGARLLVASQQPDGSWGRDHGARRALIAWRTFSRVDPGAAA